MDWLSLKAAARTQVPMPELKQDQTGFSTAPPLRNAPEIGYCFETNQRVENDARIDRAELVRFASGETRRKF